MATGNNECLLAALSSDGRTLALATRTHPEAAESIEVWDVLLAHRRRLLLDNKGTQGFHNASGSQLVRSLTFSPDGRVLASITEAGLVAGQYEVRLRSMQSGRIIRALTVSGVASLAFSPDGQTLAVGGHREIRFWKLDALLKTSRP